MIENIIIIIGFTLTICVICLSNDRKEDIKYLLIDYQTELITGGLVGLLIALIVCMIILVTRGDLQ